MSTEWRLQQALSAFHAGMTTLAGEDEDTAASALAGETIEALEAAVRDLAMMALEDADKAKVARARTADLLDRAKRFEARAQRRRGIILAVMDAMGWRKKEWPEVTVSQRAAQAGLLITDEALIPDEYMRVTKAPDKAAIKEAIKDGVIIDGAVMANGSPSIQIRGN